MLGKRRLLLIAASAASISTWLGAQEAPDPKARVQAMVLNLKQSQAELSHYEWVETTAMSLKGEEKSRTQSRVYHGADGKLQKIPIGAPPEEEKSRGVRGRIKGNKKEDIAEFMQKAAARIAEYVPPDPEKLQAAVAAGKVGTQILEPGKRARVIIPGYLSAGDTLSIDMDLTTNRLLAARIATFVESPEDPVVLSVDFGTLADGATIFAQTVVLDAPSKDISVRTENSGYRRSGP